MNTRSKGGVLVAVRTGSAKVARKAGAVVALAGSAIGSASAAVASYPTTLEGIQAWAEPKVAVAIGLAVFFTCVYLAIKISKTPRRA